MSQPALLIDCHKIINWLEDRKKLGKDWYNYQKAAQEKIKILLKDHQEYVEYENLYSYLKQHTQSFHYCDVVHFTQQILKTKWAENKNILFGYNDKRVKDWVSLKKFMDNRLIGIVNIAKFLNQGLSFDLPSLDKNIEMLDNQVTNLKRKIDFNQNTVFQQEKQSTNQRIKLGLTTDKNATVASQIPQLVRHTPQVFQNAFQIATKLKPFYAAYQAYCQENQCPNSLPMLSFFLQKGDDFQAAYEKSENVPKDQEKYSQFSKWQPTNEWGIQIAGVSETKTNQNYQTILEARSTRLELLEDLNQLLFFYQSYRTEISESSKNSRNASFQQENSCIKFVQGQILEAIQTMQKLIGLINGDITQRVELKNNVKVYQILLKKFRNYEQNIEHIAKQNKQYEIQIEQISKRRQILVKELRKLRARLVDSKNYCETALSEFIKRQVRITGQINKLE